MSLRFVLDHELTPTLRDQIVTVWTDLTNVGGAVGFEGKRPVPVLIFASNRFALKEHWCVLKRVMVHPGRQGHGYSAAIMREAERIGREIGWEVLHVTVRGGLGLDAFYGRLGYKEVGRLPGALRVGPGDDRDEILMWLTLI